MQSASSFMQSNMTTGQSSPVESLNIITREYEKVVKFM
jgi:hypothetical protein